jgi:hypothetical protein
MQDRYDQWKLEKTRISCDFLAGSIHPVDCSKDACLGGHPVLFSTALFILGNLRKSRPSSMRYLCRVMSMPLGETVVCNVLVYLYLLPISSSKPNTIIHTGFRRLYSW